MIKSVVKSTKLSPLLYFTIKADTANNMTNIQKWQL